MKRARRTDSHRAHSCAVADLGGSSRSARARRALVRAGQTVLAEVTLPKCLASSPPSASDAPRRAAAAVSSLSGRRGASSRRARSDSRRRVAPSVCPCASQPESIVTVGETASLTRGILRCGRLWHELTVKLLAFVKHESFASGGLTEVSAGSLRHALGPRSTPYRCDRARSTST